MYMYIHLYYAWSLWVGEFCCHGDMGPKWYSFTLSSMTILTILMREGGREGGREEEQLERGKEEKKGNENEQEHEGIDMERYLSHLED